MPVWLECGQTGLPVGGYMPAYTLCRMGVVVGVGGEVVGR